MAIFLWNSLVDFCYNFGMLQCCRHFAAFVAECLAGINQLLSLNFIYSLIDEVTENEEMLIYYLLNLFFFHCFIKTQFETIEKIQIKITINWFLLQARLSFMAF